MVVKVKRCKTMLCCGDQQEKGWFSNRAEVMIYSRFGNFFCKGLDGKYLGFSSHMVSTTQYSSITQLLSFAVEM